MPVNRKASDYPKTEGKVLSFCSQNTQKLFYFVRSLLLKCHCTCGMTMKAVLHTSFQNGSHSNTPFSSYLYSPMCTTSPSSMKNK